MFLFITLLLSQAGQAQPPASATYSAYSDWQRVVIRSPDAHATDLAGSYRKAFTGDFVTPRNGWKSGKQGDYRYEIGQGQYTIRKVNSGAQSSAISYVPLPTIDLNSTDYYTIKLDMLADSGRVPVGGLVFGVRDSLNYTGFLVNAQGSVQIIRRANGDTFSDYMPGDYFTPGVVVNRNRNRLTVRRTGGLLHFYVNDQEVRSSPYPVRMFSGNDLGMTTSGPVVTFQKLIVTVDTP